MGPVLRGLDAAASTPAYGLAVALGLGLMLMPQDRLVQALVGLPGLVGLGLGAGALLSRPAPSAKP